MGRLSSLLIGGGFQVLQQPTIYQQSKERKSLKSGALRKRLSRRSSRST